MRRTREQKYQTFTFVHTLYTSPLTKIARSSSLPVISLLIHLGMPIDFVNHWNPFFGNTLLEHYIENNNTLGVRFALSAGANVNISDDRPIRVCIHLGVRNEDILECLLEAGANVRATYEGEHAITTALLYGSAKAVRLLIAYDSPIPLNGCWLARRSSVDSRIKLSLVRACYRKRGCTL